MDSSPPPMPTPAAPHPGPPSGWRPLSGLAVTSFVLSIVFALVALSGVWISELVPVGLAVFTLVTVKPGKRRGRLLAVWAIVIALGVGSCSYGSHRFFRNKIGHMAESVLSALSAEGADAEKDAALRPWMRKATLEEDPELLAQLRTRYDAVVDTLGPYHAHVDLGTPFLGVAPLFSQPEGLVEVGTGAAPPEWQQGTVAWVVAAFERGDVRMALRLGTGEDEGVRKLLEAEEGKQAPVVSDVRFFRPGQPAAPEGP